jgi:hypothetical protein
MNSPRFNAAKQLEIADTLTRLWEGLFPQYELPSRVQFLTWSVMTTAETAAYAFNRAARKVRHESMDADQLGRYVSGIMRNEREGRHKFNSL